MLFFGFRLALLLAVFASPPDTSPPDMSESAAREEFNILVIPSRQDPGLDWWHGVLPPDQPLISRIENLVRGEDLYPLIIFSGYEVSPQGEADLLYDLTVFFPDGTKARTFRGLTGYQGQIQGSPLLPGSDLISWSCVSDYPLGRYGFEVIAYDRISGQQTRGINTINLVEFTLPPANPVDSEWYANYPINPDPSGALAACLSSPSFIIGQEGGIRWFPLWFFKHVFERNEYLVPHLLQAFSRTTDPRRQKDIILIMSVLGKLDLLENIPVGLKAFAEGLKGIRGPDPYGPMVQPEQLDMLWGEFFATGRLRPIIQVLSALNLEEYSGTMEKIKADKIELTEQVLREAQLESTFQSAVRSLLSNCRQSELLEQYCRSLIKADRLSRPQRMYLEVILKTLEEEKISFVEKVYSTEIK